MLKYPNFWNKKNSLSYILLPLSWLFCFVTFLRKLFTKTQSLPAKVICVGNISVGGTGKTPIIKNLAKALSLKKLKIAIISKGYKSKLKLAKLVNINDQANEVGDEAVEIFNSISNYENIFVISAKKILESIPILNKLKPDIILVDDGMQNPSFKKDLIISLVDGLRGYGNEMIIPSGPLRQNLNDGLEKSDIISSLNPSKNIIEKFKNNPKFISINTKIEFDPIIENKKLIIVCGIGNAKKFFSLFPKDSIFLEFSDHHIYNQQDVDLINSTIKNHSCSYIVTTEKDYPKLKFFDFAAPIKLAKLKISDKDINNIIKVINEKLL